MRMFLLLLLVILTVLLPGLYFFFMLFQEDRTFSASGSFTYYLKNCEIIYIRDDQYSASNPYFQIEIPGMYPFTYDAKIESSSSATVITAKNPHAFVNACFIRIHYHVDTVWGDDMTVTCEGHCNIRQRSQEAIKFASGKGLTVSGEWVDINYPNIEANTITVNVSEGELYFDSATIAADSTISTGSGDVVFQSPSEFNIEWSGHSNYYCLGHPTGGSITTVTTPSNCYDTSGNSANSASTTCAAKYRVCPTSTCTGTGPTVTVTATQGSIYGNGITAAGSVLDTGASTTSSQLYNGNIAAQALFVQTLQSANQNFNDTSKGDKVEIIQIGNVHARSTAMARTVVSPNDAYLQAKPWWVTVFSAQMLINIPTIHTGRLAPGFCPWRPAFTISQVNQIQTLIKSYFADITNYFAYIQPAIAAWPTNTFPSTSSGYLESKENNEDYFLRTSTDDLGNVIVKEVKIGDNGALLAAIVISIVISSILAVVGTVISVYALNKAFSLFSQDSEHIRRYAKRYKELFDLQNQESAVPSPVQNVISNATGLKRQKTKAAKGKNKVNPAYLLLENEDPKKSDLAGGSGLGSSQFGMKDEPQKNKIPRKFNQNRLKGKFTSTLKNLPPPFAIIDHIVFLIKRSLTNSLSQFLKEYFKEIPQEQIEDTRGSVPLMDMKLQYERYCFLKHYSERQVNNSKGASKISKFGFDFVKKRDNLTQVYKKIRFLSEAEIMKRRMHGHGQQFSEDVPSIEHFLNNECTITQFDADVVNVNTFKARYLKFCEVNRLDNMVITRSLMNRYGIESSKLELTFIQRKPHNMSKKQLEARGFIVGAMNFFQKCKTGCTNCCKKCCNRRQKYYAINSEGMEQRLHQLVLGYLHQRSAFVKRPSPFTRLWCLYDLLSVFLHVVSILFFTFAPVLLIFFQELVFGMYQSTVYQDKFELEDITVAPWNLPLKIPILSIWNLILLSLSAANLIIAVGELIVYYRYMHFPIDTLRHFETRVTKAPKNLIQNIFHVLQWVYIFLIIGILSGYVALVLIWAVLGAILNPTAYLYYATAAFTLVTFVTVKIKEYQKLQSKGIEYLMEVMASKIKNIMDNVLKKMLLKSDVISKDVQSMLEQTYEIAKDPQAAFQKKIIAFINQTPVGKKIAAAGFDLKTIVKMAQGDMDAVVQFALQRGIPRAVAEGLVALLRRDFDKVIESVKTLASHPAIKVPPALIDTIVSILFNPSEVNVKNTVNSLTLNLFDIVKDRLPGFHMPHFELCRPIFPMVFQAIWELKNGQFDNFIDLLMSLNRLLYNAVEKRTSFELNFDPENIEIEDFDQDDLNKKEIQKQQKKLNKYRDLFTDQGVPNFCLPLQYLSLLELLKIPLAAVTNISLDNERLRVATFNILRHFAGIDRVILDFVSMVFTQSREKLMASSSSSALTRKDQYRIIEEMSQLLKIKPFIPKMMAKFAFGDKTFDEKFFEDVATLINEYVFGKENKYQIHKGFVEVAFGLYTLLTTKNVKKSLTKMAERFGVDPHSAQAFLRISSKVEFSTESWHKFMNSDLMNLVAKSLRISKKEVTGIISLLMGDLLNPNIQEILLNFCRRHEMPDTLVPLIKSLLALIVSDDSEEVLNALKILKVRDQSLALLGKKMVHPKFIDSKDFEAVGLPEYLPVLKERFTLDMDHEEKFERWMRALSRAILFQDHYIHQDGAPPSRRSSRVGSKQSGHLGPPTTNLQDTDSLTKMEKELEKIGPQLPGDDVTPFGPALPPDNGFPPLVMNKEPSYQYRGTPNAQRPGTALSVKERRKRIYVDQERKLVAEKLLNLRSTQISADFVETLIKYFESKSKLDLELNQDQYEKVAKLLSIKDIIFNESKNLVSLAIHNFASLFGYSTKILRSLVDIITAGNMGEIDISLKNLFKQKVEQSVREESLAEFAKLASEELSSVYQLEKVVKSISNVLGFPKFIISRLIAPFLTQSMQLNVNDVCFLFDIIGFNDTTFKNKGISLSRDISVNKLRYMVANMAIGNIPDMSEVLKIFNIDANLAQLLEAIIIGRPRMTIRLLIQIFNRVNELKFKIPQKVFDFFMATFVFFKGYAASFQFQDPIEVNPSILKKQAEILDASKSTKINTYQFLGRIFHIYPQFFKGLELVMRGEVKELPDVLEQLMYKAQEFGSQVIEPTLVKGIISIVAGKIFSTEDLAQRLSVNPDLLDVCILLARFARGDQKVKKCIDALKSSNSFSLLCQHLKIDMDLFLNLLKLTFNKVDPSQVVEVFLSLGVQNYCDIGVLQSILSICKGYVNRDIYDTKSFELATKIREENLHELKINIKPLTKALRLEADLAVIGLRLTQGDWKIIDDYQQYLSPFLPTHKVRKVVMGLCGMLRCPVKFHTPLYKYPDKFQFPVNFEGAVEQLADSLWINPLIFRLVTFDKTLYDHIEKKYKFPRQCLIAIIVSICNLPMFIVNYIFERDLWKRVTLLNNRNESLRKKLKKRDEERKKKEEEKKGEDEKKEDEKKEDEKKEDEGAKEEKEENEEEKEEEEDQKSGEEDEKKEAQDSGYDYDDYGSDYDDYDDWDDSEEEDDEDDEQDDEEEDEVEGDIRLTTGLGQDLLKGTYDEMNTIFDKIDFQDPKYADQCEKFLEKYNVDDRDWKEEYFEVVLFNYAPYMTYKYDDVMNEEKQQKSFMLSQNECKNLVGSRAEWEDAMARTFFHNPKDQELWEEPDEEEGKHKGEKRFRGFEKTWLRKEDRKYAKNIWGIFKKLLRDLSADLKITNSEEWEYDRMTVSQLVMGVSIMGARRKVEHASWTCTKDQYILMCGDLDMVFYYIELDAILTGKLSRQFDKLRAIKMMGMALNIRFSNALEESMLPSVFRKEMFEEFEKNYKKAFYHLPGTEQEIDDFKEQYNKYYKYLEDQEIFLNYAWDELRDFLDDPNDLMDAKNCYIDCNPYDVKEIRKWNPKAGYFKYIPNDWDLGYERDQDSDDDDDDKEVEIFGKGSSLELKKKMMVKPLEFKGIENPKEEEIDPRSGQPLYQVLSILASIERHTIVDHDPLSFILGVGENSEIVWNDYKELLTKAGLIKTEQSLQVYKSVQGLINLSKTTKDFIEKKRRKQRVEPPNVKMLLSAAASNVNIDQVLFEDLLMLAHGNFSLSHFSNIGTRFQAPPELINAFFLSAMPHEFISNPNAVRKMLWPFIQRLGIDPSIVLSLISIFNGQIKGWLTLARFIAKKIDSGSFAILQRLLNVINWRQLQKIRLLKIQIQDPMRLLNENFINSLLQIGDMVVGVLYPHQGKAPWLSKHTVLKISFEMIRAIYQGDVGGTLAKLKEVRNLFDIRDEGVIDFFESLVLLLNKKLLKDQHDAIEKAVQTFASFLCSIIMGSGGDVDEFKRMVSGVVQVVFGAVYSDWSLLERGAAEMHEGFAFVLDIFRMFSRVKNFRKLSIVELLRSDIPVARRLKLSVKVVVRIILKAVKEFTDLKIQAEKEAEEKKKNKDNDKRLLNQEKDLLPSAFGKTTENIVQWMQEIVDEFGDKFDELPPTLINVPEKKIIREIKKQKDKLVEPGAFQKGIAGEDRYELFMEALITGNIHLFLEVLKDASEGVNKKWKEAIELVIACYEIITMDRSEFERLAEHLSKQDEDAQDFDLSDPINRFAKNIALLLEKLFKRKKKHSDNMGQRRESNAFSTFLEIMTSPAIIANVVRVLMAIRFNLLNKSFMFKILILLISTVGEATKWKRNGEDLDSLFEKLMIAFFGCDLQNLSKVEEKRVPMVTRIENLFEFMIRVFIPDLAPFRAMLMRLLNLIFELFSHHSFQEMGSVLTKNLESFGYLFGVNPQLLHGIIGILNGDYEALAAMAAPIADINPEVITRIISFLEDVKNMLFDYDRRNALLAKNKDKKGEMREDQWRDIMQKIQEGTATYHELFQMVDQEGDGSGGVNKEEFKAMLWRLQVKMSEHRVAQIFAASQRAISGANDDNPNELNEKEFEEAMKYIEEKSSLSALEILGLSTTQLILIFIVLLSVLVLLFVFIFLGIQAFSIGGTFGSIINSLLPITAGLTVGKKKDVDETSEKKKADKAYEEVDHILQVEE